MPIKRFLVIIALSVAAYGQANVTSDNAYPSFLPWSTFGSISWNVSTNTYALNSGSVAIAFCGPLWPSSSGSVTLSGAETDFQTNTTAGSSIYNVQLFAGAATGPPSQPTAGASSYLATSSNITTSGANNPNNQRTYVAFTGNYAATAGNYYCVVYSYSTFNGSDKLTFNYLSQRLTFSETVISTATGWTNGGSAATWTAASAGTMPLLLKCSDGTWASLGRTMATRGGPASLAFQTGSTTKEYGGQFQYANSVNVVGVCGNNPITGAANAIYTLYTGVAPGTSIATATVSQNQVQNTTSSNVLCYPFTFSGSNTGAIGANTPFWISLQSSTTSNVTLYYQVFSAAAEMTASDGGQYASFLVSRNTIGSGSWNQTLTDRPALAPEISQIGNKGGSGSQH